MNTILDDVLRAIMQGPPKQYAPLTLPHNLRETEADHCQRPTCPHPEAQRHIGYCAECSKENAT